MTTPFRETTPEPWEAEGRVFPAEEADPERFAECRELGEHDLRTVAVVTSPSGVATHYRCRRCDRGLQVS